MNLKPGLAGRLCAVLLCLAGARAFAADGPALDVRQKALNDLLAEQWQYQLEQSPEFATVLGDYRYNDRWSDNSLAHVEVQRKATEAFLARFEAIDTTGFPETDRLNQVLMVEQLKDSLQAIKLGIYEMPLDQFNGAHLNFPQFVSIIPVDSVQHYEDYIARLHAIPHQLDNLVDVARKGMADGLMPPRYLLEKVAAQCAAIAKPAGAASPFALPVKTFAAGIPVKEQKRLRAAVIAAVDHDVRPAYRKLTAFVTREYAPHGRLQEGLWALPNGAALYRYAIHTLTTTDMDPEAIHQLGLSEVARIEAEQTDIARQLGYADLKTFRAALKKDPKIHPTSRQQILDLYTKYIAQMQPELPKLFGLLPRSNVQVMAVESYREKEAAGASYQQGTPDGSRPGLVYVNTGDFRNRSTLTIESTAYHEGVPGHHMQIAIAQTLPGLPPFRQQGGYTAYAEGWALYSERLGKEVGFYKDPYSNYGRLSDELLRANRLVLDTGVHYKHWTRQQMVDWFHEHSSDDEPDLQSETDRYIAWPAQALAYKLGQLKILSLRETAKQELGEHFDIRAFHDRILDGGALPLDVLDTRVKAWIADVKAGKAGG